MRLKTEHQQRIEEFMSGFQEIPETPTVPLFSTRYLRAKLIMEEACETVRALGFDPTNFVKDPGEQFPKLEEIAKECADLSVVTIGTLSACGIADEEILRSVDENNILKRQTGHEDPETGKWMKDPNHPKPDISTILYSQRNPM